MQEEGRQRAVHVIHLAGQDAGPSAHHVQPVALVEAHHARVAGCAVLRRGVGVGGEDVVVVAVELEPQGAVVLGQRVQHDHVVSRHWYDVGTWCGAKHQQLTYFLICLCWPSSKASASRAAGRGSILLDLSPGRVIPVTYELVLQWPHCQAPGVIGSALGLVNLMSYAETG